MHPQVRRGRQAECLGERCRRRVEIVQPGTRSEYRQRLAGQVGPACFPGGACCLSREVLGPRTRPGLPVTQRHLGFDDGGLRAGREVSKLAAPDVRQLDPGILP